MAYRRIAFLQGEDAKPVLKLLEESGEEQALDCLAASDDGTGDVFEDPDGGENDAVCEDGRYYMVYNTKAGYIGLMAIEDALPKPGMIPFCDLPDIERFRLRDAIEEHGGDVDGYHGTDVQVILPTDWQQFISTMGRLGLRVVPGSRYYFPLGSDVGFAPSHQKHDGSYPGSKAFWCFARFNVPDYCPM